MKNNFKTPWFLSDTFFGFFFAFVFVCSVAVWIAMAVGAYTVISAGPEGIGKAVGEAVKSYKDTVK
jgi:hypothetical protein